MRQHVEDTGFGPPARHPLGRERRTVLFAELVATVALALCTLIAATVLSVGIARADMTGAMLGHYIHRSASITSSLL